MPEESVLHAVRTGLQYRRRHQLKAGASSFLKIVTGLAPRSFYAVAEQLHCMATHATLGMEFLDVVGNRRVISKGTLPIGGKMRH